MRRAGRIKRKKSETNKSARTKRKNRLGDTLCYFVSIKSTLFNVAKSAQQFLEFFDFLLDKTEQLSCGWQPNLVQIVTEEIKSIGIESDALKKHYQHLISAEMPRFKLKTLEISETKNNSPVNLKSAKFGDYNLRRGRGRKQIVNVIKKTMNGIFISGDKSIRSNKMDSRLKKKKKLKLKTAAMLVNGNSPSQISEVKQEVNGHIKEVASISATNPDNKISEEIKSAVKKRISINKTNQLANNVTVNGNKSDCSIQVNGTLSMSTLLNNNSNSSSNTSNSIPSNGSYNIKTDPKTGEVKLVKKRVYPSKDAPPGESKRALYKCPDCDHITHHKKNLPRHRLVKHGIKQIPRRLSKQSLNDSSKDVFSEDANSTETFIAKQNSLDASTLSTTATPLDAETVSIDSQKTESSLAGQSDSQPTSNIGQSSQILGDNISDEEKLFLFAACQEDTSVPLNEQLLPLTTQTDPDFDARSQVSTSFAVTCLEVAQSMLLSDSLPPLCAVDDINPVTPVEVKESIPDELPDASKSITVLSPMKCESPNSFSYPVSNVNLVSHTSAGNYDMGDGIRSLDTSSLDGENYSIETANSDDNININCKIWANESTNTQGADDTSVVPNNDNTKYYQCPECRHRTRHKWNLPRHRYIRHGVMEKSKKVKTFAHNGNLKDRSLKAKKS